MLPITLAVFVLSVVGVLSATGQTVNEDLKTTAPDGAVNDQFGFSFVIDNGVVAVGAFGKHAGSGSAYHFDASIGVQITRLLTSDDT